MEKAMLIDISKCMGCRGCQVACKGWNDLPGGKTVQSGSYQNPPDLNANTWCLIRFNEKATDKGMKWMFRKDHCLHCTDAACQKACPSGAISTTKQGAVVINQEKCIGCKYCINVCPFNIPRYNGDTGKATKCTLCYDRLAEGMTPACAKTCPTGAVTFGDKDKMVASGKKRVEKLGAGAMLYGDAFVGGTHVMYVLPEKPDMYAGLPTSPRVPFTLLGWKYIFKPLTLLSLFGALGLAFVHYLTKGPKHPEEEGGN